MTGKSSNSSIAGPGFFQRLKYLSGLLGMYRQRARDGNDFTWLHNALADYRTLTSKYRSGTFDDCRVLEIGFGARPLRLMAMNALGMDATGVDLDRPMTRGTPAEAIAIWKKNGAERAIKSLARYWLNDRRERRDLLAELGIADARPRLPLDRMIVSSAAADAFWQGLDGQFDVIVSEDVFEHIPRDDLETVVARMHGKLKPDGLALIRPMVFSGIAGGHHLEWYSHKADLDIPRSTEPWEHLRRNRDPANTYLNGMLRRDYREMFSRHFDIVEEIVKEPDLGKSQMTPEIRAELAEYPDEELFSNNVMFVLKPAVDAC